jgi:hypothetical protein
MRMLEEVRRLFLNETIGMLRLAELHSGLISCRCPGRAANILKRPDRQQTDTRNGEPGSQFTSVCLHDQWFKNQNEYGSRPSTTIR